MDIIKPGAYLTDKYEAPETTSIKKNHGKYDYLVRTRYSILYVQ